MAKTTFAILFVILSFAATQELNFLEDFDISAHIMRGEVTVNANCDANATFHNTNVTFTPEIVKPKAEIFASANGHSTVDVTIKANNIIVMLGNRKLINEFEEINKTVKANEKFTYDYKDKLPFFLLKGQYTVYSKLVDQDGKVISCLSGSFKW